MKGSTAKRCSCPPQHDSKGRRKACPKRHGSWSYVVDVGRDSKTGKRKQLKKGGFRTQAEAESAMAEVIAEVDQGRYRHDGRQTFGAYLEQWFADKKSELRPTTVGNYARGVAHATRHVGHVRLRDLQPGHLGKMYRDLLVECEARGTGPRTVDTVHVAVRSALNDARREGLIRTNPAMDATVPKWTTKKVKPWDGLELGTFLDHVAAHPFGPIYELMAMGGLRRGEALGLRWEEDVFLDESYLLVNQQLVSVYDKDLAPSHLAKMVCSSCGLRHHAMYFGPPKTSSGEARRVDLGQTAVGVLLAQKLVQDEQKEAMGDAYVDHGLVFADVDGNPLRPNNVTKQFIRLARESGVRQLRLHDLRHGRASLMLASGADMTLVSKMMGHSRLGITSDLYSHLIGGVGTQAAEAADSLIIRRSRDQSVTNPAPEADKTLSDATGKGL